MELLIFALLVILVFTALQIERILKDIRTQNEKILEVLQSEKEKDKYISNRLEEDN